MRSKNFIKVVDALSSDAGGEGTDILFDIEEIMFNDDHVSLATREEIRTEHRGGSSVNVGFIEGTFQSETLQWSGSSVNFVNIRAGKGDDLLVGGSGADRFEPQAGNDTINGAGDNTASYNGSDGQHFFEYADSVRFSGDPNRFTISKENV